MIRAQQRGKVQELADLLGAEVCFCTHYLYPDGCAGEWICVPPTPTPEFDVHGDLIQRIEVDNYTHGHRFVGYLEE